MEKILLITILIIIGFSSMANEQTYAQNTWVLWERFSTQGGGPISDWQINSAYPNYEMCTKKKNSKLESGLADWKRRSQGSKMHSLGDDGFMTGEELPDGGFKIWFYYEAKCFPDTIDPRK
jgi:hypothetical protein